MIICNGGPRVSLDNAVLFPFDDWSLPFQNGVRMQLIGHRTPCGRTKVVLGTGAPGAADSKLVVYCGTVQRVGDELWMWYLGQGDDDEWLQRVCLAKSKDGYTWEKPSLGLVEYNGRRDNNLVDLLEGKHLVGSCIVFYEPDDPVPERRFKMAFGSFKYSSKLSVAYSEDGLRWKESPDNPLGPWFEMSGGTKFNGCYYLNGQGAGHFGNGRKMVTHASYDFEHWTQATALSFRRDNLPPRPIEHQWNAGEQVHIGAALWNRGNVIIGFYGQWHGHPSGDRRLITMDIGFIVSNDALHYKEPIPDFRIVSALEDGWALPPAGDTAVHLPALVQGQGFENIGDKTLFWYSPWPEHKSKGIRMATWTRDRLGYFESFIGASQDAHFTSAPLDLEGKPARVYLNVDGVSEHSKVSVEVLDEGFKVVSGYSRLECSAPRESGLKQIVRWQNREIVDKIDDPIRIQVNFEGVRPEDLKIYAVYVEQSKA